MSASPRPRFVLLFGPPAVGKMTVGMAVAEQTGFRLYHNHVAIEPVLPYWAFSHASFQRLVGTFRRVFFEEALKSDWPGLVFTFCWGLELEDDTRYVEGLLAQFAEAGWDCSVVELAASQEERLRRNRTPLRLAHKASKRDLSFSENNLRQMDENHRLNSRPGELDHLPGYQRIESTELSAPAVAELIIAGFVR